MRKAEVERKTKETEVKVELNLDGKGKGDIFTGIGFFDHMLNSFARHGLFDLKISCNGDLDCDKHHTIEDVGIVLGRALRKTIGEKKGIRRYGSKTIPMDEALCLCAVDFGGRPYLVMDEKFKREYVGDFPTECVYDFLYSLSVNSKMNLQVKLLNGRNDHHKIECIFKALSRCLREACEVDPRNKNNLPSTKGVL